MKISWIKYEKDNKSFKMPEALGMEVFKIKDPESTDEKIKQLINENYTTVVLSNEISAFSQDIIRKYSKDKNINIIIANSKE